MGLDVYLYQYTQPREKVLADEALIERTENTAFKNYENMSEAQKERAREKVSALKRDLGYEPESYDHPGRQRIQLKSSKHPDHLFGLGYYRSSYNEGGLNAVMSRQGLMGLHEIFGYADDYEFSPDWGAAKLRATETLAAYLSKRDGLDIQEVSRAIHLIGGNSAEILDKVRSELKRGSAFDGGWSNGHGCFFPTGLNVVAWVNGSPGFLGSGLYIVTKRDTTNDWYEQALEIVIESIDYVLAQPDQNAYCLHWSG